MRRSIYWLAIALLLAAPCHAGSIGLYANPDGTGCNVTLGATESTTIYAVGLTDSADPNGGGLDSGEFRVVGLPDSWAVSVTPDAAMTVSLGDPFADGVIFAWPTIQSGVIPLFTIVLVALTPIDNVELQVVQHLNSSGGFGTPTDCPWFHYGCGEPCDTGGVCVTGVSLSVNAPCTVAVESTTWTNVRALYR